MTGQYYITQVNTLIEGEATKMHTLK